MPKNKKTKIISLYSIQLPLLALMIAFLAAGGISAGKYLSSKNAADKQLAVLGDDDEGDSEDKNDESNDEDKNDESNDEDKNDESNDEDRNDESNDENEIEDENENEVEDENDDNGLDNEDENEVENENEVEDEVETEEIVKNADGTVSKIKKVTKNGVLVKMKVETMNTFGTKVSEKEFESGDDLEKKEFKFKTFDSQGNEKTKFEFKNEDGKEVKLKIRDNDDKLSLLEVDDNENELRIKELGKEGEKSKLSIKIKGNGFEIENEGFLTMTDFPLVVDDQTGLITVSTPVGEYALKTLPGELKVKIESEQELDDINSSDLEVADDGLEYKVTGVKREKLLGLFNVELNKILNYDASTGELLGVNETFITKLLDILSF